MSAQERNAARLAHGGLEFLHPSRARDPPVVTEKSKVRPGFLISMACTVFGQALWMTKPRVGADCADPCLFCRGHGGRTVCQSAHHAVPIRPRVHACHGVSGIPCALPFCLRCPPRYEFAPTHVEIYFVDKGVRALLHSSLSEEFHTLSCFSDGCIDWERRRRARLHNNRRYPLDRAGSPTASTAYWGCL